jgi:predicted adenylyl cyclase CyaB
MPRNIEIKAKLPELDYYKYRAQEISGQNPQIINQEDIFFHCPEGRLKLRIFSSQKGELIFYKRPNYPNIRESYYLISATTEPLKLRELLTTAYGEKGIVRKTRNLYLVGRTRIHIDQVECLGNFIELEVILDEGEDSEAGRAEGIALMKEMGIETDHLVNEAYVDLLELS